MTPRGYVIYRGPSLLNDEPIVVVAILNSNNEKTGDCVQTYILPDGGERPTAALRSGGDASVCGDCKHRPLNAGSCYVVVRQGATRVWQSLQDGQYPELSADAVQLKFAWRFVRLGTYGDPAAVPIEVWRSLLKSADGWVGYTHQWHLTKGQELREFCMASVDTAVERGVAKARGWRTFRVRLASESLLSKEGVCPASEEGGHKLQCVTCRACNGSNGLKGDIAIIVHGAKGPHQPVARYTRWRESETVEV